SIRHIHWSSRNMVTRKNANEQGETPRPTRNSRSRERTRKKLIESVERAIATKGFDSMTIEDITNGADVGFGTFYNYFTSKESITTALFNDKAAETRDIVDIINGREMDKAVAITYIQKVFLTRA